MKSMKSMESMEIGVTIHNRFDFEVRDAVTGEIKQEASAFNIILNAMWTNLLNGNNYFTRIYFGTGTGTLVPTRTSLFSAIGYKDAVAVENVMALPVSYNKKKIVLNPEEYVGSVITEVGVYGQAGLVTHALLQDSEGNTITINKTATDIVTIYATVFSTITDNEDLPMIGMPSSNDLLRYLSGLSTGISSVTFTVGSSNAPTSPFLRGTNSTSLGSIGGGFSIKDTANKKMTTPLARMSVSTGNGHIAEVAFGNMARLVLPHPTICPKKPYEAVSLGAGDGVKTKFVIPSRNIDDDSLVIKVNGAVVSNYTKKRQRRINFRYGSSYHHGGSGSSTYPAIGLKVPSRNYWYGRGQGKVQRGPYANGYMNQVEDVSQESVFPGVTTNYDVQWAVSPTDPILAIPTGTSPFIKFFDVSTDMPTVADITLDVPLPRMPWFTKFSPDGQHLYFSLYNSRLLRYKKNDNVFEKLPDIAGENVLSNRSETQYGGIDVHGDYIIARHYKNSGKYFDIYKRTGDTYTFGTIDISASSYNGGTMFNDDFTKLYFCNKTGAMEVYNVDASLNCTKQSDISLPAVSSSPSGVFPLDDRVFVVLHGGTGFAVMYRFVDDNTVELLDAPSGADPFTAYNMKPHNTFMATQDVIMYNVDRTVYCVDFSKLTTEVFFDTPPASGAAITADYLVNGIHKTDQYVLDFQVTVQFGEGV